MANLKILRVCLSSELPPEVDRQVNYIYFTYDTLSLYLGQNEFYDNFVIAESFPEEPVDQMIYLLTEDGSVHRYIDYSDQKLAEIEDGSQIELLRAAGTLVSVNANRRYLDSQQRTLTLPFNNGMYELTASARNDQVYCNDTILKYNEDKERFEIYGPDSKEFIDFSKPFRGGTTSTVEMKVDGTRLQGNVRISKIADNILRSTSDGLFAKVNDKLDKETFAEFTETYSEFKLHADDVLSNLSEEINYIESIISEEAVNKKIYSILKAKFADIQYYLDSYQQLYEKMNELETSLIQYSLQAFNDAKEDILDKIEWQDLDNNNYESDINYFNKTKEYYQKPTTIPVQPEEPASIEPEPEIPKEPEIIVDIPEDNELSEEEKQVLIAAAIQAYLNDNN